MREIKFRGRRNSTKESIYGSLITDKTKGYAIVQIKDNPINNGIASGWCFGIEKGTECQFTGLKDENGVEIYEGDILRWTSCNPFSLGEIRTVKVTYVEARYWCEGSVCAYLAELLSLEKCKVIGNVFDNPELLK